jgi:predicted nuclease of predicted toxin-antitoxin system
MRFLADMGVSVQVVEWLRLSGHDTIHLRDEQLQTLPNGEIFQKALREERIVLAFDLDFARIIAGPFGFLGASSRPTMIGKSGSCRP